MAKKPKSVKAWAVLRKNGTIDTDSVARTRSDVYGLFDLFDGEKVIPVKVTPIVTKRKG